MISRHDITNAGGWVRADGSIAFPNMAALNQAVRMSNMQVHIRLENYSQGKDPAIVKAAALLTEVKRALMPVG